MRPTFSGLRYPRSFLGLLVTGFILVALPLAGALIYSAWNTERLARCLRRYRRRSGTIPNPWHS